MNTDATIYDVAVIGSGPGGYVAAIRGSQLGLKVALIEKFTKFGGTCLHWGCIPTKALLLNADLYQKALNGKEFGIIYQDLSLDFRLVRARKEKLIKKLSLGIEYLVKKNRIQAYRGSARVQAPGVIGIEGETHEEIRARNIIIATGSEPKQIPVAKLDGQFILTSNEILNLENIPQSLLIVGGGAIGIEIATIFSRFGSKVTIVELLPHILPFEDTEISEEIFKLLTKRRIKIFTGARLENIRVQDGSVHAQIMDAQGTSQDLVTEKALIAVGRSPVTRELGLEKLGIDVSRGYISVDQHMQSNVPGIFAIGDVVATPALAHLASHEGMLAMEFIANRQSTPINYDLIPNCTFCSPEVASVGLTEKAARERGFDVTTGKFPFSAASKATILGENEGFIKLVSDRQYGQILGVHMVGPHVTELISEGTALIGLEATVADLSHLVHPHPTVSEGLMEAAYALYRGAAIHI